MNDDWKLKDKDVIMLLLPTEDGKYIVAKAVVKDEPIETLKDAIIELPEQEGKKPNLKYLIVLVRDIDKLREKLIEDIDSLDCTKNSKLKKWELIEEVLEIVDRRLGI